MSLKAAFSSRDTSCIEMAGKSPESVSLPDDALEARDECNDSAFIINKKFKGVRKKLKENDISMSDNLESPKNNPFVSVEGERWGPTEFFSFSSNLQSPHGAMSDFKG